MSWAALENEPVSTTSQNIFRDSSCICVQLINGDSVLAQVESSGWAGKSALLAIIDSKAGVERLRYDAVTSARLDALLATQVARTRENLGAAGKGNALKTAEELGTRLLKLEDELSRFRAERESLGRNVETMRRAMAMVARL